MGALINLFNNEIVLLNLHHRIGRSPQSDTCVVDRMDVSRDHAVLYWDEQVWRILDRSRNGTFVDKRILHQEFVEVHEGTILQFGDSKSTIWKVLNVDKPSNYLVARSLHKYIELASTLILWPNDEKPEASFYKGADNIWKADLGTEIRELRNKTLIHFDSLEWEFVDNEVGSTTNDMNDISKYACFVFNISANEENISLKIVINDLTLDLGERVYFYVLLKLAQQRYLDEKNGYHKEMQGWLSMEELIKYFKKEQRTDVDPYYINVQLHRFRKKVMDAGTFGYLFTNVIERRYGELRFTHPSFKIVKQDCVIAEVTQGSKKNSNANN